MVFRRVSILVTALTMVLIGSAALASIPDSNGVIHGCRKTSDGSVRVIDTAVTPNCPNGYVALNWSQTGPQGPAGVVGYEVVSDGEPVSADAGALAGHQLACPSGKVVLGGGAQTNDGSLVLVSSNPQWNGSAYEGWQGLWRNVTNSTVQTSVTIWAICGSM